MRTKKAPDHAGEAALQLATSPAKKFDWKRLGMAGLTRAAAGDFGYSAMRSLARACFAAGTAIVIDKNGNFKLIEDIQVGDYVLSRDENDPHSPLDRKRVLEKFIRVAEIWHLTVNGQLIKTTGEHPFFTERTWSFIPTTELRVGDRFLSDDGQWVACEEVYNTGKYETVYYFRVEEFSTYFVGCDEWGWSVWAHNACWVKTAAERQQVADNIVASGFKKTTQRQAKNDAAKIQQMATDMENGTFDWSKIKPHEKIIVDKDGVVMNGNHRVIAAALSGKPIPADQIVRLPSATVLETHPWIDTLPVPSP